MTYPEFELYGPPCKNSKCKGVLTNCMSLKNKNWFMKCNICDNEWFKTIASDGEVLFFRDMLKAQGILPNEK
jgi:hypothetical protein